MGTTTTTTPATTITTTTTPTTTTTTGSPVVNANGWFYLPGYLKGSVPLYQYTHNYPGYQLRHGSNTISNSLANKPIFNQKQTSTLMLYLTSFIDIYVYNLFVQ